MQIDIVGRIGNLPVPLTQPLIPLLECLVNSIEAIADCKISDGRIDMRFERDDTQSSTLDGGDDALASIRDITVVDNGSGFDDGNYRAFFLSDSTRKANRGNKGIGRFTWLKVFERASVESTFLDGDSWSKRSFVFVKSAEGVELEHVELSTIKERKTSVTLNGLRPEYGKHFPKSLETVGSKIIDHLLIYFVNGSCPLIVLHDARGQSLNLNAVFAEQAQERAQDITFCIRGHEFKATVLRYQSSSAKNHTISYCANQREVLAWKASSLEPNLSAKFTDSEGHPFVFKTYVSGPYLDSRVSAERTSFMLLPDTDLEFPDELTRQELDAGVVAALRGVAEPYMAALLQEKRQSIEAFVGDKAPQYRYQLRDQYRDRLDRISPNLSDDQLDVELYKVQRDIEVEHRQRASQIKAGPLESAQGNVEYATLYEQFLDEENELGKAALARYVVHRRTILEMLESALKAQGNGAFAREDFVHSLIYPMRANSDGVDFARQNLWVVDERLAYHAHLASDLPLTKLKVVNATGGDEPDVVVFNTPRAFTETKSPYQSVIIVEFKRPERNEYPKGDENPVDQVLRYVRKIKEGQAKDKDLRTINVGEIPFYAYILCSLTPRIRAIAESRDFVKTPDNEGYFKYHQNGGCYIEIVSYDKVLNDAKKRNRAFFECLQIPIT